MLDKNLHIDMESGCMCRYVRSDTEYFRPHNHNYYEIFMVISGNVCHLINGREQNLCVGQLLFIRDFDIHDHKSADGKPFEMINLAFPKEYFESMIEYLGNKFPTKTLLNAPFPPSVIVSAREMDRLFFSLMELNNIDKEDTKIKMRALLIHIFMQYFYNYTEKKSEIPLWLELTYEKMRIPSNFIKGTQRMYEICPKSREHLCRSLKKHYNTSPCALVNDLRMEHAVNLLTTSNLSITEICYECGFENISWFYKTFEQKYSITPLQYRKHHNIK